MKTEKEILKAKCGCIAEVLENPFPALLIKRQCKDYPNCDRNKTWVLEDDILAQPKGCGIIKEGLIK